MLERIQQIGAATAGYSRLYADFVRAAQSGVPPYLEGVPAERDAWQRRSDIAAAAATARPQELWAGVVDEVREYSEGCGTNAEVLTALDKARSGGAYFVVTGQQPGVLGGPLHTVYKIATTIACANRISDMLSAPVVPLYWCGSDDTDFWEIRALEMATTQYAVVGTAIAQSAYRNGMPVGDISVEAVADVWKSVASFAAAYPGGEHVASVIEAEVESAPDHGRLTAAILTRMFDGAIAVVDGRMPSVRRCTQQLFVDYVQRENEVKERVRAGGEALRGAGYHAQLTVGDDSGVFLIDDGLRKAVAADERDRLAAAVADDVERCSPGVILRNLVQDACFKPLAVVLGPAELAYRAQISGVYEMFDIARPVNIPRMGATWLPAEVAGAVADAIDPGGIEILVEDPAGLKTHLYEKSLPKDLVDAVSLLKQDVGEALNRFETSVQAELPDKLRGKVRGRVGDVRKRTDAIADTLFDAGKKIARDRWPFVGELDQLVRPDGKLQERSLWSMMPFLSGGSGDDLTAMADRFLNDVMDDDGGHIVYSTRP